ncbi:MAG TPA: CheR family methyltransferase [Candidatus Polarisedimenticolaceae bacterium]|nr:CheR family methyltransferase [Candidatus Polarisedimenticolaceae bacterium]
MRAATRSAADLEEVEAALLLEGVYRVYGYDFRDYVRSTVLKRIRACAREERVPTVSALQERLLRDPLAVRRFVSAMALHPTGLFRKPAVYKAFRSRVAPLLRERSRLRMWSLGCATGEEVYSMAVLLHEEGLDDKSQIYATDLDAEAVRHAAAGAFPLAALKAAEAGYRAAGGPGQLADYYRVDSRRGIFRRPLRRNIVFSPYNLVTDGSFNEFDVILCRNVLPSLQPTLQSRVHRLIRDSLARTGVLALEPDEMRPPYRELYEPIDPAHGLFRRVG